MTDNRSNISQPVNAKTACAANAQRSLVMDAVGNFALGEIRGHIPINLSGGGIIVPNLLVGDVPYKVYYNQFTVGQQINVPEAGEQAVRDFMSRYDSFRNDEAPDKMMRADLDATPETKQKIKDLFLIVMKKTHAYLANEAREVLSEVNIGENYIPKEHNKPLWTLKDYQHDLIIPANNTDVPKIQSVYSGEGEGNMADILVPVANLKTMAVDKKGPFEVVVPHIEPYFSFIGEPSKTIEDNPAGGKKAVKKLVDLLMDTRGNFVSALDIYCSEKGSNYAPAILVGP